MIVHVAGLIFLWANRVFFTLVLLVSMKVYFRRAQGPNKSYALNNIVISTWQIVGTFLFLDVFQRSPFNLLWWYPAGWLVLTIARTIGTDIRRWSARSGNEYRAGKGD